jgi:hypothetical protein
MAKLVIRKRKRPSPLVAIGANVVMPLVARKLGAVDLYVFSLICRTMHEHWRRFIAPKTTFNLDEIAKRRMWNLLFSIEDPDRLDVGSYAQPRSALVTTAARNGHLPILRWIDRFAPGRYAWLPSAAAEAAHVGRSETTMYLTERFVALARSDDRIIHPDQIVANVAACAAHANRTQLVRDIIDRFGVPREAKQVDGCLADVACIHADASLAEWLYERGLKPRSPRVMDHAAFNGNLDAVTWLHSIGAKCSVWAMNLAASRGFDRVVVWLHANRKEGCTHAAVDMAVTTGHVGLVRWLLTHGYPCSSYAFDMSAATADLEFVKFLVEHNACVANFTHNALALAAGSGNLGIVEYLHGLGCEGSESVIDSAAEAGNLEIVQWLHHNRHDGCTTAAMDNAAARGHLDVVQWLHHNRTEGCSTEAIDGSAANGHIDVVRWLHEFRTEGCTTRAVDNAAGNGDLIMLTWLLDNRSEGGSSDGAAEAAISGEFESVFRLHVKKQPITGTALCAACRCGFEDIADYLLDVVGLPPTSLALCAAAIGGHVDIVARLHGADHALVCDPLTLEIVARSGHIDVLEGLHEGGAPSMKSLVGIPHGELAREVSDWIATHVSSLPE